MGKSSQTTHDCFDSSHKVTITRPHHPLLGRQLEIRQASQATVIVTLPDGSRAKLPRAWTDIDGSPSRSDLRSQTRFTVGGLRELLELVERLRARR
jgi:hypothetical protein